MAAAVAIMVATAACWCALYTMTLLDRWRAWATDSINRAEWIVLFHRDGSELRDSYAGRLEGIGYRIRCASVDSLGADAVAFASVFDAHPESRGLADESACRVVLSVSEREASSMMGVELATPWGFVADAGIRKKMFSSKFTPKFLGSDTLAGFLSAILPIALSLALCMLAVSFRLDLARAWKVIRTEFHVITLPLVGAVLARLVMMIFELIKVGIEPIIDRLMQSFLLQSVGPERSIFGATVYAPIVEEVVFRYALFTILCRWWSPLAAAVMASAVFAASHLELHDTPRTITLFVAGMLFQWLYVRYRSIVLCMAAHSVNNAVVSLARALNESY